MSGDTDRILAERVIQQGLAREDQVRECLAALQVLREMGVRPLPSLRDLLVQRGYLSASADGPAAAPTSFVPEDVREALKKPENDLGRYVLVELLGKGGKGEVYRAWEKKLGRYVAIKFIRAGDADDFARFVREAQILANLNHPNIAAVYEMCERDRLPYIVMQYVRGVTVDKAKLDLRGILRAVRDAAMAIHFAHTKGIIHRDLKPGNLMIDGDHVYVMDFGMARQIHSDVVISQTGVIVGTPAYMSPEQARGKSADGRSDVYSLGATLYSLLTGRLPFCLEENEDVMAMLRRIEEEDPPEPRRLNRQIPREVETIIMKAMDKDPARRYQTAEELAQDINRFLDNEPIRAQRSTVIYRIRKKIAKHRAIAALCATTVVTVGLLSGYLVIESRQRAADLRQAREDLARAEAATELEEKLRLYERAGRLLPEARAKAQDVQEMIDRRKEARLHYDQAIEHLQRLERLYSLSSPDQRQIQQAVTQATGLFAKALQADPKFADAAVGLARLYLETGNDLEARRWCDRAIGLDSNLAAAYLLRALIDLERYERMVHERQDRVPVSSVEVRRLWDDIQKDLDRVRALDGQAAGLDLALGLLLFANGKYVQSVEHLRRYLGVNPGDWRAEQWCSHACYHANRPKDAVEHATRAIDLRPGSAASYLNRAMALCAMGRHNEEMQDYRRAVQADPMNATAWIRLGSKLLAQADYPGAIEALSRAIGIDDSRALAFFSRALAHERSGNVEAALADYSQAIRLQPAYSEAYNHRGLLRRKKDLQGAIEDFTKAIEHQPDMASAYYNRGDAYRELGDPAAAIQDYSRAIQAAPRFANAYHHRAHAYESLGGLQNLRAAVADLQKALECAEPGWSERAHVQSELNRLRTAIEQDGYE